MHIDVVTIFPGMFQPFLATSIVGRAVSGGAMTVHARDLRDHTPDRHRTVDDLPYGGGAGMVMKPGPIFACLEALRLQREGVPHVVVLSPRGRLYRQDHAGALARRPWVVLICGHYKGIDQRVSALADEEISIGDYVLSGGEVPAMVVIDSLARLLPGVVGDARSVEEDSHFHDLLAPPEYTRPDDFRGHKVPAVLRSGHHGDIESWRADQAVRVTRERRPDLLRRHIEGIVGHERAARRTTESST